MCKWRGNLNCVLSVTGCWLCWDIPGNDSHTRTYRHHSNIHTSVWWCQHWALWQWSWYAKLSLQYYHNCHLCFHSTEFMKIDNIDWQLIKFQNPIAAIAQQVTCYLIINTIALSLLCWLLFLLKNIVNLLQCSLCFQQVWTPHLMMVYTLVCSLLIRWLVMVIIT